MEKIELKAKIRDVFGRKVNKGRKSGLIPAVVYGKGVESANLWINRLDFRRLLKKVGQSAMISLEIDGKNGRNVIIYELQRNPVTDKIIHVDFFQVRMDEEIKTNIELVYIGESLAVRDLGGVLVRNMDDIEIKCLPGDLPSHIDVDISSLKTFDERICVKDLAIPAKVKVEIDPETVVALVSPPRSEEELGKLDEKVEADVTKVEGVVKEEASAEEEGAPTEKEEGKKEEK